MIEILIYFKILWDMNKKKYSFNICRIGIVDLFLFGFFNVFIVKVVRMCFKVYMVMMEM